MNELANRRNNLFKLMKENSVALVYAGAAKISSEDEFYPFIANTSFFYLTGIEQENSILALVKGVGSNKTYIFADEYNELKEKWTGKRLTFDEVAQISGIDNVYSTGRFDAMLELFLAKENNQFGNISTIYIDLSPEIKIAEKYSTTQFAEDFSIKFPKIALMDLKPYVTTLRMVKSEEEVNNIRTAIELTKAGINNVLLSLRGGISEHALSDNFEFYGRSHGRTKLAFPTITASGKNATCLHYPQQNDPVGNNDLVLFDLGFAYKGYCADISRTYPASGVFCGKQRDIYEAVLNTNKAVIGYARPGLTIKDLQEYCKNYLKNECIRLKLMTPEEDITKYYYHNVSHHLGIDTHDVANREKPLEEGNVITVEPGLYFADLGIGVRIEDDILICKNKAECLSASIPKEISDIQKLLKSRGF